VAGDAASEIRANAGGIGNATLDYARTDGRADRERAARGKAGFEEVRARYEDLLGARADEGWGQISPSAGPKPRCPKASWTATTSRGRRTTASEKVSPGSETSSANSRGRA